MKRGRNEGNIYRRADGRWCARVSTGTRSGKRTRRWLYGETRAEVATKLRDALDAQAQGLVPSPGRTTVDQFMARWLAAVRPKIREGTHARYVRMVRCHVRPTLGHLPVQHLTPSLVQQWLTGLQTEGQDPAVPVNRRGRPRLGAGLAPRTVRFALAVVRAALADAVRWGELPRNVAAVVHAPRLSHTPSFRTLTTEQARALLDASEGHAWARGLLTVALSLGLRRNEALGLQWAAVDLDHGVLHVRGALARVDGKWAVDEPKTRRALRSLPLPEVCADALRAHRKRQLQQRLFAGGRWSDTGFVFTTRTGQAITPGALAKTFKILLRRAGVPDVRFHDLRHTAATFLLVQGVDPRTIMETLGHSQINLTMNTYTHVMPALQRDAAAKMHRLLKGGVG